MGVRVPLSAPLFGPFALVAPVELSIANHSPFVDRFAVTCLPDSRLEAVHDGRDGARDSTDRPAQGSTVSQHGAQSSLSGVL